MTTNLTFPQQRKKKYDFPWWEVFFAVVWMWDSRHGLYVEFPFNKVSIWQSIQKTKLNKVNSPDKVDHDVWMVGLGNFIWNPLTQQMVAY